MKEPDPLIDVMSNKEQLVNAKLMKKLSAKERRNGDRNLLFFDNSRRGLGRKRQQQYLVAPCYAIK